MYGLEPVKKEDVINYLQRNDKLDSYYLQLLTECLSLAIEYEYEGYLNGSCKVDVSYEERIKITAKICLNICAYVLR